MWLKRNNRAKNIPKFIEGEGGLNRLRNSVSGAGQIQFPFKLGYLNRVSLASALCVTITPPKPPGAVWDPNSQQGVGKVSQVSL